MSSAKRKRTRRRRAERERVIQLALYGFEPVEPLGYKRSNYSFTQDWRQVEASKNMR